VLPLLSSAAALPVRSQSDGDPIHKIRHIVIIMQENRSFDSYFGTFPGADGIPMKNGVPTVCAPDPQTNTCIRPYFDGNDRNRGGPHSAKAAVARSSTAAGWTVSLKWRSAEGAPAAIPTRRTARAGPT